MTIFFQPKWCDLLEIHVDLRSDNDIYHTQILGRSKNTANLQDFGKKIVCELNRVCDDPRNTLSDIHWLWNMFDEFLQSYHSQTPLGSYPSRPGARIRGFHTILQGSSPQTVSFCNFMTVGRLGKLGFHNCIR